MSLPISNRSAKRSLDEFSSVSPPPIKRQSVLEQPLTIGGSTKNSFSTAPVESSHSNKTKEIFNKSITNLETGFGTEPSFNSDSFQKNQIESTEISPQLQPEQSDSSEETKAESFYKRGMGFMNNMQYQKAIETFQEGLKIEMSNPTTKAHLHFNLGCAQANNHQLDDAINSFQSGLATNNPLDELNVVLLHSLALTLQAKNPDTAEVVETLQLALALDSPNETKLRLYTDLGKTLTRLGRLKEAISVFMEGYKLKVKNESKAALLLQFGIALEQAKQFKRAIAVYHDGVILEDVNESTENALCDNCLLAFNDFYAIATDEEKTEYCLHIGKMFDESTRPEHAIGVYRKAFEENGISEQAKAQFCIRLGKALKNDGQLTEAIAIFEIGLCFEEASTDTESKLLIHLGITQDKIGQIDNAMITFNKGLLVKNISNEGKAKLYILLGLAYQQKEQFQDAMHAFEQAQKLEDVSPKTKSELNSNYIDAMICFYSDQIKQVSVSDQDKALLSLKLGRIFVEKKNDTEAIKNYQLGLRFDIVDDEIKATLANNLGLLLGNISDFKQAIDVFENALKFTGASDEIQAKICNNLGSVFIKTTQYKHAIKAYEKGVACSNASTATKHVLSENLSFARKIMI